MDYKQIIEDFFIEFPDLKEEPFKTIVELIATKVEKNNQEKQIKIINNFNNLYNQCNEILKKYNTLLTEHKELQKEYNKPFKFGVN